MNGAWNFNFTEKKLKIPRDGLWCKVKENTITLIVEEKDGYFVDKDGSVWSSAEEVTVNFCN